eukprot:2130459-Prymnesium_polylepis.1
MLDVCGAAASSTGSAAAATRCEFTASPNLLRPPTTSILRRHHRGQLCARRADHHVLVRSLKKKAT